MLRVAFVLRSTEVHPVFLDLSLESCRDRSVREPADCSVKGGMARASCIPLSWVFFLTAVRVRSTLTVAVPLDFARLAALGHASAFGHALASGLTLAPSTAPAPAL